MRRGRGTGGGRSHCCPRGAGGGGIGVPRHHHSPGDGVKVGEALRQHVQRQLTALCEDARAAASRLLRGGPRTTAEDGAVVVAVQTGDAAPVDARAKEDQQHAKGGEEQPVLLAVVAPVPVHAEDDQGTGDEAEQVGEDGVAVASTMSLPKKVVLTRRVEGG